MSVSDLPKDVFKYLTESFLDGVEICTCMLVCKKWYFLLQDSEKRRIHYVDKPCPDLRDVFGGDLCYNFPYTLWKKYNIPYEQFGFYQKLFVKLFGSQYAKVHKYQYRYIITREMNNMEEFDNLFPKFFQWKRYCNNFIIIRYEVFSNQNDETYKRTYPKKRLRSNENYWKMKDFLEEENNNKKLKF